jgi:hypothetical protein
VFPLAYLITFTCYGRRLHGDDRGTVDRDHNTYGAPLLRPNARRAQAMAARMVETAYCLDVSRRQLVLPAVIEVAAYRGWMLAAVHVRTTHVHAVVHAEVHPDRIVKDFKAYATRAIHRGGLDVERTHVWADGGSKKYKWTTDEVRAGIHYVLHEQGEPMEAYEASPEVLRALLG